MSKVELEDRPINVYYRRMGQSAMQFQVSWWIDSYEYRLVSFDRVNTALQNTLDAAGIEMPYPTYNLNFPSPQSDLNRPVELT